MNDLAEKALNGLQAVRRQVRARPMLALGALGFALSGVVVVAGGRVGASRSTRALTTWLGLEDSHGASAEDRLPGVLMLGAIAGLLLVWLVTVAVVRRTDQPRRRVWWVAAAWAAPFALGPPLLDTSVYRYVAYGLLQRDGMDPYTSTPAQLASKVVAAIDPAARDVSSSDGPIGAVVTHLAVAIGSGNPLGALVVLRVVGVLAAISIGRLTGQLVVGADAAGDEGGDEGRGGGVALAMCALNPLVLLYIVSDPHLSGLMLAVLLSALVAARQGRWPVALALAGVAGAVLAPALVAVPVLIAVHRRSRDEHRRRLVALDVLIVAAVTGVAALVQPGGLGWVRTVADQFSSDTPFSVVGATQRVIAPIVRAASYDDLAAGARLTALIAAAAVVVYLVATARHRPLEHGVGYALLAVGLLAPVLHPWYLLWGVLCLAPTAAGARRVFVPALSAAGCLLTPPGFSNLTSNWITAAALVLIALIAVRPLVLADRRARAEALEAAEASLPDEAGEVVDESAALRAER